MAVERKIPCLGGWICVAVCFALVPVSRFAYVRLVPLALGIVIGAFCLARCLKAPSVRVVTVWVLILGVCIGAVTGGGILTYSHREPEKGLDYILVLGAGVGSPTLQERIRAAYGYLSENPDTVAVVTGGQGADEPMTEAACMQEALVSMGIGADRIWIEDRATSTWENLQYSLDIIEARTGERPGRIGVLSSEFHLFRVTRQAYDWGLQIEGIPARTEDPERWLHYFIREIAGIWHYLILGGEQG
jgi:uncharacterized SAM-binding protein YcdF (DUF218 family)